MPSAEQYRRPEHRVCGCQPPQPPRGRALLPSHAALGMQPANHDRPLKGLRRSVGITPPVRSRSPERREHFILHFSAQPHAPPAFPHCVHNCRKGGYFSLQNAYIPTSQEKDPKPTPTFSRKRWTFPPKASSSFRRRWIRGENTTKIRQHPHFPLTPAGSSGGSLCSIPYSHYF